MSRQVDQLPFCNVAVSISCERSLDVEYKRHAWAVGTVDSDDPERTVSEHASIKEFVQTAADVSSANVDGLPINPLVVIRELERVLRQHRTSAEHGLLAGDPFSAGVEELDEVDERIRRVEREEREST